jgi:predicted SAM-dependent methyltransferase
MAVNIHCSIGLCTPIPFEASTVPGVARLARVTPEWQRARGALLFPLGNNIAEIYADGKSVDDARTDAVKEALAGGMKYLFFLDYDTIPPRDAVCRLVYHLENNPEYDIAAGLYCSKSNPTWPLLWREWGNGVSWDFTLGEVLKDRVVGVPMGCTLLRVSMFEKLANDASNPWWRTVRNTIDDGDGPVPQGGTEDLWFCQRLEKELHGKILMDTGVLCEHIDNSTGLRYTLPEDCLPRRRAKEALDNRPVVLHVGCGPKTAGKLPPEFNHNQWREVRLDIDQDAQPDIVASITDMRAVGDGTITAVWSSHNLEHLHLHEVPLALREFHRVLKPGGSAMIMVPDFQAAAEEIGKGNLTGPLYQSPAGPICARDMVFGHPQFVAAGNGFQCHKTGFSQDTLGKALAAAGFTNVSVERCSESWDLRAQARKEV